MIQGRHIPGLLVGAALLMGAAATHASAPVPSFFNTKELQSSDLKAFTKWTGALARFEATLDATQRQTYKRVVAHRRALYVQGLVAGLVLAAVVVGPMRVYGGASASLCGCAAVVLVFVTTFLYYILAPKSVYMVEVLTTPVQRRAWVDVYRGMQVTPYGSFAGALVAAFVFFACLPSGVC